MNNLDGCSSTCQVETGWTCSNSAMPSTCTPICGDGIVVQGEICDDGDNSDTDKCLANCLGAVPGYFCSGGSTTSPSSCIEVCGDAVLTPSE